MTTVDQWAWWRAALKGTVGPMQEANPQSGFYRHYIGTPVAIWREGNSPVMLLDGIVVGDPIQRGKVWIEVAKHPVAKKDYDARVASGEWPSALPPLPTPAKSTEENTASPANDTARGAGDNSGDLDTYQRMRAEILGDVAEAAAFFTKTQIADKALADKATDWGDRLVKSSKEAEKARLAENEPLRRQIEENDVKWKAISGLALAKGSELRGMAETWGKAEIARIQKENAAVARKKWEAEQVELRRQREADAEEFRRQREANPVAHDADGVVPEPDPEPVLPLTPPPMPVAPAPKLMLGSGTSGNRRSVKTAAPETASIVDLVAAASFFAKQGHPELIALVQKLADRAIKARADIPGIQFSWQSAKTEAAE